MLVAAFIEAYKDAEKNRPLGMPCLEEFFVEAKKIQLSGKEAMTLYDVWLANGFRTKSGPIKDWRAPMRNWKRWAPNRGNRGFSWFYTKNRITLFAPPLSSGMSPPRPCWVQRRVASIR